MPKKKLRKHTHSIIIIINDCMPSDIFCSAKIFPAILVLLLLNQSRQKLNPFAFSSIACDACIRKCY